MTNILKNQRMDLSYKHRTLISDLKIITHDLYRVHREYLDTSQIGYDRQNRLELDEFIDYLNQSINDMTRIFSQHKDTIN